MNQREITFQDITMNAPLVGTGHKVTKNHILPRDFIHKSDDCLYDRAQVVASYWWRHFSCNPDMEHYCPLPYFAITVNVDEDELVFPKVKSVFY